MVGLRLDLFHQSSNHSVCGVVRSRQGRCNNLVANSANKQLTQSFVTQWNSDFDMFVRFVTQTLSVGPRPPSGESFRKALQAAVKKRLNHLECKLQYAQTKNDVPFCTAVGATHRTRGYYYPTFDTIPPLASQVF